jgi:uncharacterized protein YecE (DUF72 family)
MWSHQPWLGIHLPVDQPALTSYATWCTAVEGNTTHYATPDHRTVARWTDESPPDFRFLFKLPKTITHERRLRGVAHDVTDFLRRIEPLGPRVGPLCIQLPASFRTDDLDVLAAFLRECSDAHRWAVEVRDPAFFDAGRNERRFNELLASCGVERIVLDSTSLFAGPCDTTAEVEAFGRKPRLPVHPVAVGRHPIVRFIGRTDPEATARDWSRWVPRIASWIEQGREPFLFIHTPDNAMSPVLARRFHDDVAALTTIAPLPIPLTPPEQLTLLGS